MKITGDEEATCTRTGLWSSRPPACRFVDCGNVPAIANVIVHYVNGTTFLGSISKYSCDRSFSLAGMIAMKFRLGEDRIG